MRLMIVLVAALGMLLATAALGQDAKPTKEQCKQDPKTRGCEMVK